MCVACTGIIVRASSYVPSLARRSPLLCALLQVRSVFRMIEAGQGFRGYLSVHEVYFMAFDALPLAISCGVFVAVWPERHLPNTRWDALSAVPLNATVAK
jgi:hypothetical protein